MRRPIANQYGYFQSNVVVNGRPIKNVELEEYTTPRGDIVVHGHDGPTPIHYKIPPGMSMRRRRKHKHFRRLSAKKREHPSVRRSQRKR